MRSSHKFFVRKRLKKLSSSSLKKSKTARERRGNNENAVIYI